MKNDYLNKWLYCNTLYYKDEFQEIDNLDLVHNDYKIFVLNNLTNTIYECIGNEGEFLILKAKSFEIKVKKEAIKGLLPTPKYKWGDEVYEIAKPEIKAKIDDLFWHHKKGEFLYYLNINGKRKSKQYYENELKKQSPLAERNM